MGNGLGSRTHGRGAELAVLDRVIAAAAHGPAVLVLNGEPGVGKTHLLHELRTRSEDAGAAVLHGGGVWVPGVVERPSPFGPFRDAVRGAPSGPRWEALRAWRDPATAVDGAAMIDPALHAQEHFVRGLAVAAEPGPVLLIVDDLHWADVSSLGLVVHLTQSLRSERVLLALATRPPTSPDDPEAAVLLHLRRSAGTTWLDLAPLPDAAIDEVIADATADWATGREGLDSDRAERIRSLAAGNPLAARELVRSGPEESVPATTAASVALRLAAAADDVRSVVGAASVLGSTGLSPQQVQAVAGINGTSGTRALDEAVRCGLLRGGASGYAFGHPLEREAVYAGLSPAVRIRLHHDAAVVLEKSVPADWAAVASHRAAAGERPEVVRSSLEAASTAARLGAFPEALEHQVRALDAWDDPDPEALVAGSLEAAAFARWAGVPERGLGLLERLVDRTSARTATPAVWERVGWFRREIGDDEGAGSAYRHAVEALEDARAPAAERGVVLAGLAAFQMTHFELDEAAKTCRAGLDVVEGSCSAAEVSLLNTLGVVRALRGEPDDGLDLLSRSRDLALDIGDEADVWRYIGNATFVLQNVDRVSEAVDLALAAHARAKQAGVERSLAVLPVTTNGAAGLMRFGRWAEALDLATDALSGRPPPALRCRLLSYVAEIHVWAGRLDVADEVLAQARGTAVGGDPALQARLDEVAAECAFGRGDVDAARSAVEAALEPTLASDDHMARARVVALALRIEADLGRGASPSRSRVEVLEHALAHVEPDAGVPLAVARAELARVRGEDTPSQWRTIADELERAAEPHGAAYALLRCAQAQVAQRRRQAAGLTVAHARELLEPLGPTLVGNDLSAFARRARVGPAEEATSSATDRLPGLTPRESEVLRHLADGASNRQIGRALGITEKTASVHVSNLLAKLGVSTRGQAATLAHTQGWLTRQ